MHGGPNSEFQILAFYKLLKNGNKWTKI
jgi:hypothetical protein